MGSTAISWSTAFKEIHGKTPTKTDYKLAPKHVRDNFFTSNSNKPQGIEKECKRSTGIRLKRPADDEMWSPVKRPFKKRALSPTAVDEKKSPSRKLLGTLQSVVLQKITSPQKAMTSPNKRLVIEASTSKSSPLTPSKSTTSQGRSVGFRSLFDTPEKGSISVLEDLLPKTSSGMKCPLTPSKSPKKPIHRRVQLSNPGTLLMPTPEKKIPREEEILEPFPEEEVPLKTRNKPRSSKGMAAVFDPTLGRMVYRPFKKTATVTAEVSTDASQPLKVYKKKKNNDNNYVRINLKKKSFSRGKISAEQKRKMRKKQMWKARYGKKY